MLNICLYLLKGFIVRQVSNFATFEAQEGQLENVKLGFQNTKNQTKTFTIENTAGLEKRISQFRFPTPAPTVLKIRKTKWFDC